MMRRILRRLARPVMARLPSVVDRSVTAARLVLCEQAIAALRGEVAALGLAQVDAIAALRADVLLRLDAMAMTASPRPPLRTVLVGAGAHAVVVLEAMRAMGGFDVVGVVDPDPAAVVPGLLRLGGDDALAGLLSQGVAAAVLGVGGNAVRGRLGAAARDLGFDLPAVIHPGAIVSPSAQVAGGAVVMAGAILGAGCQIGAFAVINSGAVVEHDGRIGEAAHVAPGAALAGAVTVGARTLIGVGAAVRPGIQIGPDVVVGAGAAVVADLPSGIFVGVPARLR